MDAYIQAIKESDQLQQAFFITAGGMIGVFATLFVLFLVIKAFEIFKPKNGN